MLDARYWMLDTGCWMLDTGCWKQKLRTEHRVSNLTYAILLSLIFLVGCAGGSSLVKFVKEGGLEAKGLTNLALASSGTTVIVSQDNPDHPASTLINGITSSENWDQGEGWESKYEGQFARGRYLGYGVEDPTLAEERGPDESFDPGDPSWRGLRVQTRWGGSINAALGWVIIDLPAEKIVNRMIIHTIDSEKYPAEKFGVSDMMLQYWSDALNSWAVVERFGKSKGQAGNAIQNNKSSVMTLRFQPVRTSRMRFVIRWTNDTKSYKRGYYQYASGTIRLLEVELYGYESAEMEEEEIVSTTVAQDANKIAEIEIVIDNYADGYNRRNVEVLMSSISPDYSKDGETYPDLKKRMESIFAKYKQVNLELQNIKVILTDKGATATSTYTVQHGTTADEPPSIIASGVLIFQLSGTTGHWKITRIDSQ